MAITMQMRASATQPVCGPRSIRSVVPVPAALRARLAAPLARQQRTVAVRAAAEQSKPVVAKIADSIGLPTDEGIFGFKPFPEVWVGRLAMMGFLTSLLEEFWTGKGTLQQIGFTTPSGDLFVAICLLAGGATLIGTISTLSAATGGKLTLNDMARYRNFFGIQSDEQLKREADELKKSGDFTSPDNFEAIAQAQIEGSAADSFLSMGSDAEKAADQAAQQMKDSERAPNPDAGPNMSLSARSDVLEQGVFQNSEMAYARNVELTNGRWAMIGFLACIVVEAATGRGILGQLFLYFKLSGLLGENSGF